MLAAQPDKTILNVYNFQKVVHKWLLEPLTLNYKAHIRVSCRISLLSKLSYRKN